MNIPQSILFLDKLLTEKSYKIKNIKLDLLPVNAKK